MIHYNSGEVFLFDKTVSGVTSLESPDGKIIGYDFSGFAPNERLVPGLFTSNLIPTTTQSTTWEYVSDRRSGVYQAFYVAQEILPIMNGIDMNFEKVHIGAGLPAFRGIALFGSNTENAFVVLGELGNVPMGLVDVVAHELTHCYFFEVLEEPRNAIAASIHEGLADIVAVYVESVFQGNVIDWVMGDDDDAIATETDRDLENPDPNFDCFDEVKESNVATFRGLPLSHWFFLITVGSIADGIPALGIQKAMEILLDAVSDLGGTSPDYPELAAATINIALEEYGRCSDELLALALAWEHICVPLPANILIAGDFHPCSELTLTGPLYTCEENEYISICIKTPITGVNYRWTIEGLLSTEFESSYGMDGNIQAGGNCLTLTTFPNYPYYPQRVTVYVYSTFGGTDIVQTHNFTIFDCNKDDPTCEEYYEPLPKLDNSHAVDAFYQHEDQAFDSVIKYLKIYNFTGEEIYKGEYDSGLIFKLKREGLLFIQYFNASKQLIKIEKKLEIR